MEFLDEEELKEKKEMPAKYAEVTKTINHKDYFFCQ